MSPAMNQSEFQAQVEEIERLVGSVSGLADDDARTRALALLQSLMDLHGAVLSRIVEVLSNSGEAGRSSLARLGSDPAICGLMVLYGVHPVVLEDRVKRAIENALAQLRKQGGSVELIAITGEIVRVKIEGAGHGCGSSPEAFKRIVDQSILEAAPEVVEVLAEGLPASVPGFVPVNMIQPAIKEEKSYEESAA